jgi:hypothetical protein
MTQGYCCLLLRRGRGLYPALHLLPWPSDDPADPNKVFVFLYGCVAGLVFEISGGGVMVRADELPNSLKMSVPSPDDHTCQWSR